MVTLVERSGGTPFASERRIGRLGVQSRAVVQQNPLVAGIPASPEAEFKGQDTRNAILRLPRRDRRGPRHTHAV